MAIMAGMNQRYYKVRAHPGAKEDRLVEKGPGSFEVWVRAPAERGLANAAVIRLVAARLGVEAKRLRLAKGAASPSKLLALLGEVSADGPAA